MIENWDLFAGLVVAVFFASYILSMAFGHNPQGEFYKIGGEGINIGKAIPVFLISFVESFLIFFVPIRFLRMAFGGGGEVKNA